MFKPNFLYFEHTYTKIIEVNLFAFAYRLFHEDFSPLEGAYRYIMNSTSHISVSLFPITEPNK